MYCSKLQRSSSSSSSSSSSHQPISVADCGSRANHVKRLISYAQNTHFLNFDLGNCSPAAPSPLGCAPGLRSSTPLQFGAGGDKDFTDAGPFAEKGLTFKNCLSLWF